MVLPSIGRSDQGAVGSRNVLRDVQQQPGAIGYLELSYAEPKLGFPSPQFKTKRANLLSPVLPAPVLQSTPLPIHLRMTFEHRS